MAAPLSSPIAAMTRPAAGEAPHSGPADIAQPRDLNEAAAMLSAEGTVAVAGGTALRTDLASGLSVAPRWVSVAGLLPATLTKRPDALVLGASMTLEALCASREVAAGAPLLSRAVRDVAAPPVRRLATLGGQIGWGRGCLLPALLALDAKLTVRDGTNARQVTLAHWLQRPAGLVVTVVLPRLPADARWLWRKIGLRAAFTPSLLNVAAVWCEGHAAFALGGGPVRPHRLAGAEAAYARDPGDASALRAAIVDGARVPDCFFRNADYRRAVAANLLCSVRREVRAPTAGTSPRGKAPEGLAEVSPDAARARWHPRPDLPDKVTARLAYFTDTRAPDTAVGGILRAGRPHALIEAIDTSRAEALPGVYAVVTHADIEGTNAFGIMRQDQPALCDERVRYEGDAVAAVAAVNVETLAHALALIDVRYKDLPALTSPGEALADGAPALHQSGNEVARFSRLQGDPETAFAAAAHVVERINLTPRQMHGFMETEGGTATPAADGGLVIAVGAQHGARDRLQLARILGVAENTLRIVSSPSGGGFGGKDELTVQPALALLARKTGGPVRLHLSRAESVIAGTKRNPMTIAMRTACDAEGRLLAQEVDLTADGGAYASLSPAVVETALEHATGPYVVENVRTAGRLVSTNNGTCGAFRGFGANEMAFAMECQMDALADKLGLDPIEIRRRNLRRPGMPGPLGQTVGGSERLNEMLQAASASALWAPPDRHGEWLFGTGMALIYQGNGLGSLPPDEGEGVIRLAPDGAIEVLCGLDEMGQGLVAGLTAAVADALGVARADVRCRFGDTALAPDAGSTSASRGAFVISSIANGAPAFAAALLGQAARLMNQATEALALVPGGVALAAGEGPPVLTFGELARRLPADTKIEAGTSFAFPKTDYTRGNARLLFASGATVARAAVSRMTGEVRVDALELHTACGPIIDMASYLGQMEGGLVQGLGFTLSEDARCVEGRMVTRNLDTYSMPSVRDVPTRLTVTALEDLDPGDPYGPRGAGELAIGGVTPAVANAVANATGYRPSAAPFCPQAILRALEASDV